LGVWPLVLASVKAQGKVEAWFVSRSATKEVLRNQTSKRAFQKLQNECAEEYGLIPDKRYTFGRPRSWQKSPAQAPGSASADKELWKGIFVD